MVKTGASLSLSPVVRFFLFSFLSFFHSVFLSTCASVSICHSLYLYLYLSFLTFYYTTPFPHPSPIFRFFLVFQIFHLCFFLYRWASSFYSPFFRSVPFSLLYTKGKFMIMWLFFMSLCILATRF